MLRTTLRLSLLLGFGLCLVPACSDDSDDDAIVVSSPTASVYLRFVARFNTGRYDQGGSEIAAYDPVSKRLFSINAGTGTGGTVEVISLATLPVIAAAPALTINCAAFVGAAGSPNSVACKNGILAIAVQDGTTKTNAGAVVFFNADDPTFATPLNTVAVGALPDMITFTPDGLKVLVANEGEPSDDYLIDPEGSISIITINPAVLNLAPTVQTATFTAFNAQSAALIAAGVRIYGIDLTGGAPGVLTTVAKDLEPEYIALSADGLTAYVTLQENNALAIVNVATATVTQIVPLGTKDYSLASNSFDPTDQDGPGATALIRFVNGPIRGMYQPDGIASYTSGGQTYLVTANEGDVREYTALNEAGRLSSAGVVLDPVVFPAAGIGGTLKNNANFGRLNVTKRSGDTDGDGDLDVIYAFGGRGFSIRTAAGTLVWDSADDIERLIADTLPFHFNASNTSNAMDNRSDDKGPEPEGVTVATLGGRTFAFVGLERIGGVLVYDVTTPAAPTFQTYVNTRDFGTAPGAAAAPNTPVPGLDLGPEGLLFIAATDSPTGKPLLILSNEISGSIVVFQVDQVTN